MKKKRSNYIRKNGLIVLLITALLFGFIENKGSLSKVSAEEEERHLIIDITIENESGTEIKELEGTSLTNCLTKSGISNYQEITCINFKKGQVTESDWRYILMNSKASSNKRDFSCLTQILAEDEVTATTILDESNGAFTFPKTLEKVILPKGLKNIPTRAFENCSNLTEIRIPDEVTVIGNNAFSGCSSLEQIILPDGLTKIDGIFFRCSNLKELKIPDGVTEISNYSFCGCSSLEELTVPDGVTKIQRGIFSDCSNLKKITLPNSITEIGPYAFYGCNSLESITLPDSVIKIDCMAFFGCSSLQEFTVPDNVTEICGGTFNGCKKLKKLTIPAGIIISETAGTELQSALRRSVFMGCQLETLNIIVKEDPNAYNIVQPEMYYTFYGAFGSGRHLMYFYLPDGTPLSETTSPKLSELVKEYLAESWDGDAEDQFWFGWEIGQGSSVNEYSVENKLYHITNNNKNTSWESTQGNYEAVLTADSGYHLPDAIHVMIGDRDAVQGTDYTYDPDTGEVMIDKDAINGDLIIMAEGVRKRYDVTVTTSGCGRTSLKTSDVTVTAGAGSEQEVAVREGDDVSLSFMPEEGNSFVSITVDGEIKEVAGNEYTISGVQETHSVQVVFTDNVTATASPTPDPASVPTPVPTGSPATEPTLEPTVSPTPEPTATPTPVPDKDISDIADGLGVSGETAEKIQAVAKELDVSKDTILVTDKTITSQKTDNDIKGAYFARIQARATQITENNIKLVWNKVKGADGYLVYGNQCNTKKIIHEYKLLKTVTGKQSYIQRKCKKGSYYKFIVRAYKNIDGKKVSIAVSKTIHVVTNGGKNGNAKAVTTNKSRISLKKGKSFQLKAKEKKQKKILRYHRKVCYESSNPKVASISKKGVIKGKKKGKCTIYAYAQSGIYKKVNINVK